MCSGVYFRACWTASGNITLVSVAKYVHNHPIFVWLLLLGAVIFSSKEVPRQHNLAEADAIVLFDVFIAFAVCCAGVTTQLYGWVVGSFGALPAPQPAPEMRRLKRSLFAMNFIPSHT